MVIRVVSWWAAYAGGMCYAIALWQCSQAPRDHRCAHDCASQSGGGDLVTEDRGRLSRSAGGSR